MKEHGPVVLAQRLQETVIKLELNAEDHPRGSKCLAENKEEEVQTMQV